MQRLSLTDPPYASGTGKGVVVAVVDSGIHADHPHIDQSVIGGRCVLPGIDAGDWVDRIGHGTAVAAAIHEKAPDAALLAVRVFDRSLATTAQALADGIVWAADHGAHLINLSLGTANPTHEAVLTEALEHAKARGSIVVSAREWNDQRWLPGSLPGAVGVLLDAGCERDQLAIVDAAGPIYAASGFPRPIPGVPVERNLSGISFAVANVTRFHAREPGPRARFSSSP